MSSLTITLIDVGWGDSILIETTTAAGETRFALVDCNDSKNLPSAYIFVKRHLERRKIELPERKPIFDFVLLTHDHSDHGRGIKTMMQAFGTDWFWYSKSVEFGGFAHLLKYANRSSNVRRHQAVDQTSVMPPFGEVNLTALWPPHSPGGSPHDTSNENNNSVVLLLTLGQVSFLLTGDCEADNWPQITGQLPQDLAVFQVPHHGAVNGVFDSHGATPWLSHLAADVRLAISSHIRPHDHPAPEVVQQLNNQAVDYYRTDLHYHISFKTDGTRDPAGDPSLAVSWTHV